jgi:DnaD/phage-associated family protein
MSISLMSLVYKAHFQDITYLHKGKKKGSGEVYEKQIRALNSNLKSVCLALADHANDEGEGTYPSIDTISSKTELSDVTVISCLKAMKQEAIISYVGRSKWHTCNYTINKAKLSEMTSWDRQKRAKPESKAALVSNVKPLQSESKVALHEPSETILQPHDDEAAKSLSQISKAYEAEIGIITAFIADDLKDASTTYPLKWVLDAIHEAAVQNKRGWKYCLAILKRWTAQGNQDPAKPEQTKGDSHAKRKPNNAAGSQPTPEQDEASRKLAAKIRAERQARQPARV